MRIGVIAVIPFNNQFLGIKCKKGRGYILPGGGYDSSLDKTYHATARREANEEVGISVEYHDIKYITCLPDGGDYMTFAMWCPTWNGIPKETDEGIPELVGWNHLLNYSGPFVSYYRVLYDIMQGKYTY